MKNYPIWWVGTLKQKFPEFDLKKLNHADIVIIGGGFNGLLAAYHLKQSNDYKEKIIVVLDAKLIGSGATGMSGGFLAPSVEADVIDVIDEFGKDGARAFWRLKTHLGRKIVELIEKYGIKCNLKNVGSLYLQTANSKKWHAYFREEAKLRSEFGYKTEFLTREQLRKYVRTTDSFYGGIYNPTEYCVNPLLLLKGFAEVCTKMGIKIFENSRVGNVEFRDGINIVRTEHGDITANIVVFSCWSKITDFVKLKKAEESYTFLLATPELPAEILQEIGAQEGLMMWDSVPPPLFAYFRIVERRLLFGGLDTFKKNPRKMDESYGKLIEIMLKYFPPLGKLKKPVEHFWYGDFLTMGFDERPSIGYVENTNEKQIYTFGPGILFSFLCGMMVRDWITGKMCEETEILDGLDKRYFSKRKIAGMFPRVTKFFLDRFLSR